MILTDEEIIAIDDALFEESKVTRLELARAVIAAYEKKLREQSEPVATREWNDVKCKYEYCTDGNNEEYLYLHPAPQSEWQPIETALNYHR